jgi:hypothetical protein
MTNPLKIQEPDLLSAHNVIVECFVENGLPFEAEYQNESDPKFNSTVSYVLNFDQPRIGFIVSDKGIFKGVVYRNEKIEYFQKEGFEDEHIFLEEPILSGSAPCPLLFVSILAYPKIKELTFSEEMWADFNRVSGKQKKGMKK